MPAKKSSTPVVASTKSAKKTATRAAEPAAAPKKAPAVTTKTTTKAAAKSETAKTTTKKTKSEEVLDETLTAEAAPKKKAGRPAKAASADKPAAKRGRKPKAAAKEESDLDDADLSDIEEDLVAEVVEEVTDTAQPAEKVKPLRMKISKAKERALMKEFGLDETVLSEEDPDQAGQDAWLPHARRNQRPPARQAGRGRDAGSGGLPAQRHGRGRL